jgi:hypothetical protein
VTVATAAHAVNESPQARIGALLRDRQFPQIPAGFQSQTPSGSLLKPRFGFEASRYGSMNSDV